MNSNNNKSKIERLIDSFNYAINGIVASIKSERNMKIHYFIALFVLILSLFFNFTRLEFLALFFSITLVLTLELINTSIEYVVDLITDEYHKYAELAKDIAAGAVLLSALNALVVGYLLFFDRITNLTDKVLFKIKKSPIHMTFIALTLVILFTIGLKAKFYRGHGTHFQGGVVSGHSAVAFTMATIITFITENVLVITLSFGLAFLVGESRIEGNIHTPAEVILGSILGIIVGILVFQLVS